MENKESNRPLIQIDSAEFSETYSLGDIVHLGELKREQDDLSTKVQQQWGILYKRLPAVISDAKSAKRWTELTNSTDEIAQTAISLIERLQRHPEGKTMNGRSLAFLLSSASQSLAYNNIERQKSLAEKSNFSYLYNPIAEARQFTAGTYTCKINGVSIKDIMDNPNLSSSSFYGFAIESQLVRINRSHSEILQENQTPLTTAYPSLAKANIEEATGYVMMMTNTSPERFEWLVSHFLPHPSNTENKLIATARNMIKRTDNLNKKLINTLFNPNASEFLPLMTVVENYLDQESQDLRTSALFRLGLYNNENIAKAYRKAKELAGQNNENSPFYKLLQKSIRQYIEELPQELGILTSDDLPLFIDVDKTVEGDAVPTLEDLRRTAISIFNKSSHKEYQSEEGDSDNEEIDLANMISPNFIRVEFPKGHPNIFNIYFYYENEQGESTVLELNFDTRKGIFDWKPFIEDTADPKMAELRKAVLLASYSVLSQIQQQTEADYQQKQAERQVETQTPQATIRQSRPKEPYIPRGKVAREKRTRPITPIQEVLQGEFSFLMQPEQQKIKNQIVLSPNESLDKITGNLSEEDRRLVTKGIEEYNERSVGQFKMLRLPGKEDKPLFTLRVNCGTGGGIRVLMHETPNLTEANNTRAFEILDIDYRKNIYRKRGL